MKRAKLRVGLPLAVLVLFSLYANLRVVNKEIGRLHGPGRYEAALYEARLEPLKHALPEDAVVGYVTDETVDIGERSKWFYLTRYSLCPMLVLQGKDYPFVIGGYYGIGKSEGAEAADLVLLRDFGYGIRLYKGTPP